MKLHISYVVSDKVYSVPPEDWNRLPSEGIDTISVETNLGSTLFQGHSIYWLYQENANWVVGRASPYTPEITEVVISPEGTHVGRKIKYMPDLYHGQVKLGWWRPGVARPK